MFYLKKDISIKNLTIQEDEVESISFMSIDKIKDILDKGLMNEGHYKVLERVLEYKEDVKSSFLYIVFIKSSIILLDNLLGILPGRKNGIK